MLKVVKSSKGGLIATHNLQFVKESCSRVIYLEKGKVEFFGNAVEGVELYLKKIGFSKKEFNNEKIELAED